MRRKLTGSERVVWKHGAISLNLVLLARFDGVITLPETQRVWKVLQERHPLLNAHLERDGSDVLWSTQGTSPVPVRHKTLPADKGWEPEVARELKTPFTSFSPYPFVRSVLCDHGKGSSVIISCHHCICDGLSIISLVRDFTTCLAGEEDNIKSSSFDLLMDNLLPTSARLPLPQSLLIKVMNFCASPLKPLNQVTKINMPASEVFACSMDRGQTADWLAVCKRQQVTVHSALSTLFQQAQAHVLGAHNDLGQQVYSPISVRAKLTRDVGGNFGLYASEAYISSPYNPARNFWENGRAFQHALQKSLAEQKTLRPISLAGKILPRLLDRLMIYLYKGQRLKYGLMISNLGSLRFVAAAKGPALRAIYGPVGYVRRAEKSLTVLTLNGEMIFTIIFRPGQISGEKIRAIKEKAMALLATYSSR